MRPKTIAFGDIIGLRGGSAIYRSGRRKSLNESDVLLKRVPNSDSLIDWLFHIYDNEPFIQSAVFFHVLRKAYNMKLLIFRSINKNIDCLAALCRNADEVVVASIPDESNLHSGRWDAVVQYYEELLPQMRSNLHRYAQDASDAYSIIEGDVGSLYATYYALIEGIQIKPIFMNSDFVRMTKFTVKRRGLINHLFDMILSNAKVDHSLQNVKILNALKAQSRCDAPLLNGRIFSLPEIM